MTIIEAPRSPSRGLRSAVVGALALVALGCSGDADDAAVPNDAPAPFAAAVGDAGTIKVSDPVDCTGDEPGNSPRVSNPFSIGGVGFVAGVSGRLVISTQPGSREVFTADATAGDDGAFCITPITLPPGQYKAVFTFGSGTGKQKVFRIVDDPATTTSSSTTPTSSSTSTSTSTTVPASTTSPTTAPATSTPGTTIPGTSSTSSTSSTSTTVPPSTDPDVSVLPPTTPPPTTTTIAATTTVPSTSGPTSSVGTTTTAVDQLPGVSSTAASTTSVAGGAVTSTSTSGGTIPDTGRRSGRDGIVAASLILLGALLVVTARRRPKIS